jgi:hypothetical protein
MRKHQIEWLLKELEGRKKELKQREERYSKNKNHREADILVIKQEELETCTRLTKFAMKLKP